LIAVFILSIFTSILSILTCTHLFEHINTTKLEAINLNKCKPENLFFKLIRLKKMVSLKKKLSGVFDRKSIYLSSNNITHGLR